MASPTTSGRRAPARTSWLQACSSCADDDSLVPDRFGKACGEALGCDGDGYVPFATRDVLGRDASEGAFLGMDELRQRLGRMALLEEQKPLKADQYASVIWRVLELVAAPLESPSALQFAVVAHEEDLQRLLQISPSGEQTWMGDAGFTIQSADIMQKLAKRHGIHTRDNVGVAVAHCSGKVLASVAHYFGQASLYAHGKEGESRMSMTSAELRDVLQGRGVVFSRTIDGEVNVLPAAQQYRGQVWRLKVSALHVPQTNAQHEKLTARGKPPAPPIPAPPPTMPVPAQRTADSAVSAASALVNAPASQSFTLPRRSADSASSSSSAAKTAPPSQSFPPPPPRRSADSLPSSSLPCGASTTVSAFGGTVLLELPAESQPPALAQTMGDGCDGFGLTANIQHHMTPLTSMRKSEASGFPRSSGGETRGKARTTSTELATQSTTMEILQNTWQEILQYSRRFASFDECCNNEERDNAHDNVKSPMIFQKMLSSKSGKNGRRTKEMHADPDAPFATSQSRQKTSSDARFDAAGKSAISKEEETYRPLDCVYEHPQSKAKLYIGNVHAARSKQTLSRFGITHVVNCQGADSENFFEKDSRMTYLRFPIGSWQHASDMDTNNGVLQYFSTIVSFVTKALEDGRNVLIHCLAGMHRAGASGVAVLMFLNGCNSAETLEAVRRVRPSVELVLSLKVLIGRLDAALGHVVA
eukprot:TRINITY_DN8925_c2_g2_i1.p1 TRINITY_DN8925_c2_g2~~TRINITY_DN8925_c2_g2_i1.p1  ORF type:complete len:702 (-),score=64.68 TRINITY_DN8925_c2_g2_i1:192-2297(-)